MTTHLVYYDIQQATRFILHMDTANGRRLYNVALYIIDWAHTENDPWPVCTLRKDDVFEANSQALC